MNTTVYIADPETGEAISLDTLTDRELDELHLHLSAMQREYAALEREVWRHLRERAITNGGLNGSKRRWVVQSRTHRTAVPEFK